MKEYSLDNVCTGDHKADNVNSRIMEVAGDYADELTERDCHLDNIECYEEDETGLSFTEEAQEIFNEYYDSKIDELYALVNSCIKVHES